MLGIFLPPPQCSCDKVWINCNPKVMNEWTNEMLINPSIPNIWSKGKVILVLQQVAYSSSIKQFNREKNI